MTETICHSTMLYDLADELRQQGAGRVKTQSLEDAATRLDEQTVTIHALRTRAAELEAQLDAIGAGGIAPLLAPPTRRQPLTEPQYTALAHRIASKYAHRTDPGFIAYTFLPHTLEQFVRAIEAGPGIGVTE
jgi:hypothetical protein